MFEGLRHTPSLRFVTFPVCHAILGQSFTSLSMWHLIMMSTVQPEFYEEAFCSPSLVSFSSTSCCLSFLSFSHLTEYLLCLIAVSVTASQVVVQGWSPSTRPSSQSWHLLSWSLVTLLFTQTSSHDWNLVCRRLATTGWHYQQTAKATIISPRKLFRSHVFP